MRKVLYGLGYLEEFLVASAVLIVVVINFASIVTREIGIRMGQAQEVMLLMFVWITFLGIPLATKRRAHLGLSLFVDLLPAKLQRYTTLLALAVALFFLGTLGYFGVKMVIQEYNTLQTTPSLGLPVWPFGAAVPVSALLTAIRFLEIAYNDLVGGGAKEVAE